MAKRTKRKGAATSRSRSKTTRSTAKRAATKRAATKRAATKRTATKRTAAKRTAAKKSGRKRTPAVRSGKVKRKSPATSSRRRRAGKVSPRRRRVDGEEISERGAQIVEIPTDPARFDSDLPPDTAELAREVADSMVGDEEPGGTVMVPDHDSVDEYAAALGVERSPDSPVRGSEEILRERDERRWPGGPSPDEQRRTI